MVTKKMVLLCLQMKSSFKCETAPPPTKKQNGLFLILWRKSNLENIPTIPGTATANLEWPHNLSYISSCISLK